MCLDCAARRAPRVRAAVVIMNSTLSLFVMMQATGRIVGWGNWRLDFPRCRLDEFERVKRMHGL
jgi:hypothetical protein